MPFKLTAVLFLAASAALLLQDAGTAGENEKIAAGLSSLAKRELPFMFTLDSSKEDFISRNESVNPEYKGKFYRDGKLVDASPLAAYLFGDSGAVLSNADSLWRKAREEKDCYDDPKLGVGWRVKSLAGANRRIRYLKNYIIDVDLTRRSGGFTKEQLADIEEFLVDRIGNGLCDAIEARRRSGDTRSQNERLNNGHADCYAILGLVAFAFPSNPNSVKFLETVLAEIDNQLENSVFDGSWCELTGYGRYQLTILSYLLPVLKSHFGIDRISHPNLKAMIRFYIRSQTPKDLTAEGRVLVIAVGGGPCEGVGYASALACFAPFCRESDPELAGNIAWFCGRATGSNPSLLGGDQPNPDFLLDNRIKQIEMDISKSGLLSQKAGIAVMRCDYGKENEKWLYFHNGTALSHDDNDENSFSIYAYGYPVSLDPGTSTGGESFFRPTQYHNTVGFGGRDLLKYGGFIEKFETKPEYDYVIGNGTVNSKSEKWRRHLLFVKPYYFIVWDEIRGGEKAEFFIHCISGEQGALDGNRLSFITKQGGIRMELDFLKPAGPLAVAHRKCQTPDAPIYGRRDLGIQWGAAVSNEAGGDFLAVLNVYKDAAESVKNASVAADGTIKVELNNGISHQIRFIGVNDTVEVK